MPLPPEIGDSLDAYARGDLDGELFDRVAFFDFPGDDVELQRRVGEEYFTARYLDEFFEGMRIEGEWPRRAHPLRRRRSGNVRSGSQVPSSRRRRWV